MNIFATSPCPMMSAQWLDNSRVNKMVLESGQMLSLRLIQSGELKVGDLDIAGFPRLGLAHESHPCVLWIKERPENYDWLAAHFIALLEEKQLRFGRPHSYEKFRSAFQPAGIWLEARDFTQCVDDSCRHSDPHLGHRTNLRRKWAQDKRAPRWTNRLAPYWSGMR